MKHKQSLLIASLAFTALLIWVGVGVAQTGGEYDLTWNTVDGGSGISQGGVYSLKGTIGQPDAGSVSGGIFGLDSGFWIKGTQALLDFLVHLPLVLK